MYLQASDQKTSFTKYFQIPTKRPKLALEIGNGSLQMGDEIIFYASQIPPNGNLSIEEELNIVKKTRSKLLAGTQSLDVSKSSNRLE